MATFLDKLENKVQIHHLHVKRFHVVKILRQSVQYIRRYSTKYAKPHREHATQFWLECSPPKLLYRSSPKFYTYSSISGAVQSCIYTALSHSVSECQSGVGNFTTKLVAMATSLKISGKEGQIDYLQLSTNDAKIMKIGPVDPEILRFRAKTSGMTQNWLPWQRPLSNWKNWIGSRKFTQIGPTFHLVKKSWKSVQ